MTRREDFVQPWGRETSDDVFGLQVLEDKYKSHRKHVMEMKAHVDSSEPISRTGDIFSSGKAPHMRRDRQRLIDIDNQKMVENMAEILRIGGPTMRNANSQPYRQIRAPEEVKRIREAQRIERENKLIADRLRNKVRPEIDHRQQARDYEKNVRVRRNISAAAKRKERTLKEAARKKRLERDAASRSMNSMDELVTFGEEGGYGDSSGMFLGNTRGVTGLNKLRTAKDVRTKVASERGDTLPDWLVSDRTYLPAPSSNNNHRTSQGGASSTNTQSLVLSHKGAPSAPVLSMPPFPMG